MGVVSLVDNGHRTQFFRQTVLRNVKYWLEWLDKAKDGDVEVLDSERSNIVKAILFALDLGQTAWPLTRQLLTTFSPYMERRGEWDTWSIVLGQAIATIEKTEDSSSTAHLSALLARLSFWQNRFQASTTYYRRAIKVARQAGDRFVEAQACSNLGYYYIEHGFWNRAEVLCCHALDLFEQINSTHGLAHTENHLGILYTWQGNWAKAQRHLERACNLWQQMDDNYGLMNGYNNLGRLFNEMNQADEALTYLEKAIHYATKTGVETLIGNIFINLGIAHQQRGELTRAEDYFRQAEAIFRQYATLAELARAQDNLGLVYLEQQRWQEANTQLESALAIWQALRKTFNQIQTLTFLVECELSRANKQMARTHLDEAQILLSQFSHAKPYQHLHQKVKKFATA